MHSLLKRQLRRIFGDTFQAPPEWSPLLEAVDESYREFDTDREMIERSLELSSQELMRANSEMRAVFLAIPDLLFRIDHTGVILSLKTGAREDNSTPPERLVGHRIQDFASGAMGDRFDAALRQVVSEGRLVSFEYELNMSERTHTYEARLVPAAQQQIIVIIRNVTERFRAEQLKQGQKQALELIASGAHLDSVIGLLAHLLSTQLPGGAVAVFLSDPAGTRLDYVAGKGLTPDFIAGLGPLAICEGSSWSGTAAHRNQAVLSADIAVDPFCAEWRQPFLGQGFRSTWALPIRSQSGRVLGTFTVYHRHRIMPTDDQQGMVEVMAHIAGIAIERKNSEQALRSAEEKYRAIVENALEGIFQCAPDGHILEANPAFAAMLGASSPPATQTVPALRMQDFIGPDCYAEFTRAIERDGFVKRFETQMLRPDGTKLWISLNARLVLNPEGFVRYYEGIAEDITERRRLEERFLQSQKMDAFGQLAGGVAHDFNNILTVISGNLTLASHHLARHVDPRPLLAEIQTATERAAQLTRQLLTFSRQRPIHVRDIDLNAVVAGMTKMLQRLIGEHISLETCYDPHSTPVKADPGMMEQAVMNLAVNSRDAMPEGGRLQIQTSKVNINSAEVAARPGAKPGPAICLRVSDTGHGIEPEHMSHIFEPFYTTKENGKGTGLGLATVFGIVKQHGGWIEVDSKMGSGTNFHLYLPIGDASTSPAPLPPVRSALGSAELRGNETILVVEDEVSVRVLLERILGAHGYKVVSAENGPDALDVWEGHKAHIRVLITDMIMPAGMNGRELADKLHLDRPSLPVIYCSGYSDQIMKPAGWLGACDAFLEKPVDLARLLRQVRSCIDRN